MAPAPVSLSRTAISRRATPRSRHSRTISTDSTRTASENQAKARSEASSIPNRLGPAMRVDWGSGRPVHRLAAPAGTFQHGVASTDAHEPEAEGQGAHGQVEAPHPQGGQPHQHGDHRGHRPGEGHEQDEGHAGARGGRPCRAPQATSPNWPERDLARPAGEHGQRQGDDARRCRSARAGTTVPVLSTKGSRAATTTARHDPGGAHPPAQRDCRAAAGARELLEPGRALLAAATRSAGRRSARAAPPAPGRRAPGPPGPCWTGSTPGSPGSPPRRWRRRRPRSG